ncbi:MAG: DUF2806 domain-containing protein [Labilithrix sp.]|nr:DUF2806 domain-containing protein [Labilithrix sp.]
MAENKSDALVTSAEAAFLTGLSAYFGFPVPPTFAKNVVAATSSLVVAALTVPTAWLEGVAVRLRADAEAKAKVAGGAVPIALETIAADQELGRRATMHLGGRMLREQTNREAVAKQTLEEIRVNPPREDATAAIDEDWLDMFARHAETKTNDEMRAYFARILAGEIRKPGSFSPATLEVLARLTPDLASLFQQFCNISATIGDDSEPCVLCAPYGAPGANALEPLGFSYSQICRLQDAGLVRSDFTSYKVFPSAFLAFVPLVLAGAPVPLVSDKPHDELQRELAGRGERQSCLNFSRAGEEIRQIVHMTPNTLYAAKFIEWAGKHGMRPKPSP